MIRTMRYAEESAKHVLLSVFVCAALVPVIWMLSVSLRSPDEAFGRHLFWSGHLDWHGYRQAFTEVPFFRWLSNSFQIGVVQTLGQLFVGVCAAFAFAYYRFPGRDALFLFVLMTMMIPLQVTMVPTYLIVSSMNLLNTFAGVTLPHMASGFAIFLLRQSFLSVPKELAEAATIDGCGPFRVMGHVYVRLSGTMLWTLAVILFLGNFNEFNWPLLVLTDPERMPLPLAFQYFQSETRLDWSATMAVATLSMIPVLLLYLAAQRHIIEGFAQSGLKG